MFGLLGLLGIAFAGMMMVPVMRSTAEDDDETTDEDADEVDVPLPTIPLSLLGEVSGTDADAIDEPAETMLGVEDNDPGVLLVETTALRDVYQGDEADDDRTGTDGDDWHDGGEGDDRLSGLGGNDKIDGGEGDDTLVGGGGADRLDGGAGRDALTGGTGNDDLVGGAGADVMMGGEGDDTLDGRDGAGGPEADFLNGGDGDDILWGDPLDWMNGGAGADRFGVTSNVETIGRTTIDDYDEDEDTLVLLYPGDSAVPVLTQTADADGVTIFADGAPVAMLRGLAEIDLGRIEQVAS